MAGVCASHEIIGFRVLMEKKMETNIMGYLGVI